MAKYGETGIKGLQIWLGQLKDDRRSWEPFWRDVQQYVAPDRARFLNDGATQTNDGRRRDNKIINGAGTQALDVAASGMQSGKTNKMRPWLNFVHPVKRINDLAEVQRYYQIVKDALFYYYAKTNAYNAFYNGLWDMLSFGTAVSGQFHHPRKMLYFRNYTCGRYYLSMNQYLEVDGVVVFEYMTCRQIVLSYDENKIPRVVKAAYDGNNLERRFKVYYAVITNPGDFDIKVPNGMPVAGIHFMDEDENKALKVEGFRSFPFATPRWNTIDNDTYGICPMRQLIGDVKQLQMMEQDKLTGLRIMNNPPMKGPSELERRGIDASPGGFTAVNGQPDSLSPLYTIQPPLQAQQGAIDRVIYYIQQGAFNDLFRMLFQRDQYTDAEMTAREVVERHEEKLLMLGPVLEKVDTEYLDVTVARSIELLYFAGAIPPPPPVLRELPTQIEYISVLSQAQKAIGIGKNTDLMRYVGNMTGVFANLPMAIDEYAALEDYAAAVGTPPGIVMPRDVYEQRKSQANAMQQAAVQNQIAGQAAAAGKTAADIDSANLQQIMEMMTGGGSATGRVVL